LKLTDFYRLFSTNSECIRYLESLRWQGKPICPYCDSTRTTHLVKGERHHCNRCNAPFRVTVYTVFHHTHLPLQKWFYAIWLTLNTKKGRSESGIPARELAEDLQVNKNTASRMARRIRKSMAEAEQRALIQEIGKLGDVPVRDGSDDEESLEAA
jgi:transposase-like protein